MGPGPVAHAVAVTRSDVRCLARAMWHEARGEPLEGRIAVAEVVLARMADRRFPKTACGVVAQRAQFSFVSHGRIPVVPADQADEMSALARRVASGRIRSRAYGCLWFHARGVRPVWRHALIRTAAIGGHLFYGRERKA